MLCKEAGVDGISIYLRENRHHIQDLDVYEIADQLTTKMNLEMSATEEMLAIACEMQHFWVCLVR